MAMNSTGLPYLRIMQYKFIAIEGNIGSGKTTLASKLASYYNAGLILETFEDNPFLSKFYHDNTRYALPVELSFLTTRYTQLEKYLNLHQQNLQVADYTIAKSQLFAQMNLAPDEYTLFAKIANVMEINLPQPDLLIYLHTTVDRLQQRIRQRGRIYEQNIKNEYLQTIEAMYLDYLQILKSSRLLILDTTDADFNDSDHLSQVVSLIQEKMPSGSRFRIA